MTDESTRAERGEGYAVNAPYYDLIIPREHWDSVADAVTGLLKGARRVAEIGAGTGHFTAALLRALGPDAEIRAIEPARVMRAALVTRLAADPAAERAVTVLPEDALTADPGTDLDAVLLLNLVMHFGPDERARLWRRWADALRPGGLLVVEAQHPQTAEPVAPVVLPGRALGRHRYETLSRADVLDAGRVRWTNTYRTFEGDRLIRAETATFDCHVVSDAVLARELTAAGLTAVPSAPPGLHVWRR
ncbi:class I SAM-dependent methyltransferase [Actinomadura flavalba]|uniref:class I SAM-dependent methyltransferase n=1 Tax=Actinomadura flavalba TaxID=1120938 RepID=UPI0003610537|nr:class I SAM-dependent methyltransferase [Actinomadura flavalba]